MWQTAGNILTHIACFTRNSAQLAQQLDQSTLMQSDRRNILKLGLGLTAASTLASVSLVNAHTWEKLDVTYWMEGVYLDSALEKIDHLMRDHRANEQTQIDLNLLDYMHALYKLTGTDDRLHILSGYRTAKTNAALRARSSGVAKYSLHMEGRAVDINIPSVPTAELRDMAKSLQSGGVGYYARSGFVHIDTGNIRYWQS